MSTTTTSQPGFFRRMERAFVSLLKLVLLLAVLAGIAAGAWFGYQLIDSSFVNLAEFSDLNAQHIEELKGDVTDLTSERTTQDRQLDALEEEVLTLDAEVAAMTEQLTADLSRQQDVLSVLETQLTGLVADNTTTAEEVSGLSAGVMALQGDVNENIAAVDALGGNVDALGNSVDEIDSHVTEMGEAFGSLESEVMGASGEAVTAVSEMSQALTLFRAWEMVYRARLRLLEQNIGLAQQDVAVAQTLLVLLVENGGDAASSGTLLAVQQRLDLAASGLLDDPDTAVRDLESAWEMLDMILSELLGVPEIVLPQTAVISPTVTITATQPITTSP